MTTLFVEPAGARPSASNVNRNRGVERRFDSRHFLNISVDAVGGATAQNPGVVSQQTIPAGSAKEGGLDLEKVGELFPLFKQARDEGTSKFRWRKRGRLTNEFASVLGIGGETSFSDVAGWFRRHYGSEAGVVWARTLNPNLPKPKDLTNESSHDDAVRVVCAMEDSLEFGDANEDEYAPIDVVCLNLGGTCVVVCPQLVAHLGAYATLRARSVSLMNSLRARALSWVRDHQVAWESALEFMPGSIAVATRLTVQEKLALEFLGETTFADFQHVNDLGEGLVRKNKARPAWAEWLPGKYFDYVRFNLPLA